MKKVLSVALMLSCGAALVYASPAGRALMRQAQTISGWTEAARRSDPVGFIDHVTTLLKKDLTQFEATRHALAGEMSDLSRREHEQIALRDQAHTYAEEFRSSWKGGKFPVTIRNAAYSEAEVVSQVSILLAEYEGCSSNVQRLNKVRAKGESKLEELAVRIEKTTTELAVLGTERELLRARELTSTGDKLLAQVDVLLNENQHVITSNPVRSTRELMAATESAKAVSVANSKVMAFLSSETEVAGTANNEVLPVKEKTSQVQAKDVGPISVQQN